MRTASKACVALMNPYFLDQMSDILDQEKKVKHSALAQMVDSKLDDEKWWKTVELPGKQKLPSDLDPSSLDWYLGPAVQSGGKYDLKLHAEPTNDNLHAGVIIAGMGLRYKSYSSVIARTFLVDPNKTQESVYKILHTAHNLALKEVRDGHSPKTSTAKPLVTSGRKNPTWKNTS